MRHLAPTVKTRIKLRPDARAELKLQRAERAVAPGQSAVVYDGDIVLGGGTVASNLIK